MSERNHLANGRFLHDLDNWTASGAVYSAGDGDDHYGVAVLTNGDYIEQDFAVNRVRSYNLHVAVKPVSGTLSANELQARIQDDAGNTVATLSLEGDTTDTWQENTDTLGLAHGTTYTLRITNSAAIEVRIDDVWLWHVPVTRSAIAASVHDKLSRLASQASLSTSASGSDTEGDYTGSVDAGLRGVGALNPETGLPDTRYLEPDMVDTVEDIVLREMLEKLRNYYATDVDIKFGPRDEKLSQIREAVDKQLGAGSGGGGNSGGKVITRRLIHSRPDFEFD